MWIDELTITMRGPYIAQKQKIQTLKDLELIILSFFGNSLAMNYGTCLLTNFQYPYLASQPMKQFSSNYCLWFSMQPDLHSSIDR